MEYRELFGAVFAQRRNDSAFSEELLNNIVVAGPELQDKVSLSGTILTALLIFMVVTEFTEICNILYYI